MDVFYWQINAAKELASNTRCVITLAVRTDEKTDMDEERYMDFSVTASYAGLAGQHRTVEVCVEAMCLLWHMILRKAQMVIRGEKAGAGVLSSQFFARRPITVTRISEQRACNYESQKPKSPAARRGFLENSEQVNSFPGHDLFNNNTIR